MFHGGITKAKSIKDDCLQKMITNKCYNIKWFQNIVEKIQIQKKIQICITFERKKLYNNYVIKINQLRSTCT